MVTENTMNLVICVPYFETNTFKARKFELWFEDNQAEEESKSTSDQLETSPDRKKFVIRMAGLDFLLMEQMQ